MNSDSREPSLSDDSLSVSLERLLCVGRQLLASIAVYQNHTSKDSSLQLEERPGSGTESVNQVSVQEITALSGTILYSFDEYASLFDSWFLRVKEDLKSSQDLDLLELVAIHQKIIEKANELAQETRVARRELRNKGKGLKAYLDKLPKRISIRRTRTG